MSLSETSDGMLVFGLRARDAGDMPLRWHCVPAGFLEVPDPQFALKDKLTEQTGLDWNQVTSGELWALLSAGEEYGHKPELTYRLLLTETAAEVHKHYHAAHEAARNGSFTSSDSQEREVCAAHEAIIFVRIPGRDFLPDNEYKVYRQSSPLGHTGIIAAAKESPMIVEMDEFVGGACGELTDVSRRALRLLCETYATHTRILPLPLESLDCSLM